MQHQAGGVVCFFGNPSEIWLGLFSSLGLSICSLRIVQDQIDTRNPQNFEKLPGTHDCMMALNRRDPGLGQPKFEGKAISTEKPVAVVNRRSWPPCRRTVSFTMARPRPVPGVLRLVSPR